MARGHNQTAGFELASVTAPLATVDRMHRVAAALASGTPVADDDGAWLSGALIRFLDGESFEAATGLELAGTPWRRRAAQSQRHALIKELAERFFLEAPAHVVASALRRYQTTAWPREQMLTEPRPATIGTAAELLWRIFRLGGVPTSDKQIRRILAEGTLGRASDVRELVTCLTSIKEVNMDQALPEQALAPIVAALRNSPEVVGFMAKRAQQTVDNRKKIAAKIAQLENAAGPQFKDLSTAIDAAKAAYDTAQADVHAAGAAYNKAVAARTCHCTAYSAKRDALETPMIESASPLIAEFGGAMRDEWERATHEALPQTEVQINPNTGKRSVAPIKGKVVRPIDRMHAIRAAIDAALALRFEPDQSTVQDKLGALQASLPKVGISNE